jgi:chemotaxis protein MotB
LKLQARRAAAAPASGFMMNGGQAMRFRSTAAALGIVALLAACASQSSYNQQVQKTSTYQQLDARLKSELAVDEVQIEQLQNLVRLTLANGILFGEGGAELNEPGKATLAKMAPALQDITGQRIVVKGFTDNVPIGPELRPRFPSNVDLSKARADAVSAYLVDQGVPAALVSTTGLGEAHPVASNDTPQGRARNRRVEIDVVEAPK